MRTEKAKLFATLPPTHEAEANALLAKERQGWQTKIVVLDDDPTGTQTVHDIHVYTDNSRENITAGFAEETSMFFILTNSRAFSVQQTQKYHQETARRLWEISQTTGKDFLLISRSDSTLRGHYPLETETLRQTLEAEGARPFDGEILMPYFQEGGRFTIHDVHYVEEGDYLTPAGETEFARDATFGYQSSNLKDYVQEKTHGIWQAEQVLSISLAELRQGQIPSIVEKLKQATHFQKIIVNAAAPADVKIFAVALLRAWKQGKRFLFRTAAAWPKVIGGVLDKPLLTREEIVLDDSHHGGLVIVGSHVQKTTAQLEALHGLPKLHFIEFHHLRALQAQEADKEIQRVRTEAESAMQQGETAIVYTGRKRFDAGSEEASLQASVRISEALTRIVKELTVRPSFLIAKGGITSSDIATKGLHIRQALVLGQAAPGVPVWQTGSESKFVRMAYVIFPGNVGTVTTLRELVARFNHA